MIKVVLQQKAQNTHYVTSEYHFGQRPLSKFLDQQKVKPAALRAHTAE
jgi:hypothetical protein